MAISLPMPLAEPVMNATLSLSCMGGSLFVRATRMRRFRRDSRIRLFHAPTSTRLAQLRRCLFRHDLLQCRAFHPPRTWLGQVERGHPIFRGAFKPLGMRDGVAHVARAGFPMLGHHGPRKLIVLGVELVRLVAINEMDDVDGLV